LPSPSQLTQTIQERIRPRRQATARHYGVHPYFTRRAWNVVQAYIEKFTQPGDLVMDPFGGSGVTSIEALVLRRRAIHLDINPLANFVTQQIATAPVDLEALSAAYYDVLDRCRPQIEKWRQKPDTFFNNRPVPYWYPKDASLPANSDVDQVEELFTRRQLFVLSLLLDRISAVRDRILRDQLRFCFSATLAKTNRTFISARSRAPSRGGPSIFSIYRYNVPRKPVELDPWTQFQERFGNLMDCKRETNSLIGSFFSPETCRILHSSATRLPSSIQKESVDYVFTDPPYGGHIAYLDLSTMWNAWLRLPVTKKDRDQEMIEGGDLGHGRDHYLKLLDKSVAEISRVLKPKAWASIVFQHPDSSLHAALLEAARQHGLSYVNTVAQSLDVVWSMHKKKNQMKVLSGELILNFRKTVPSRTDRVQPKARFPLERLVNTSVRKRCTPGRGATTEELFNDVLIHAIETRSLPPEGFTVEDIVTLVAQQGVHFDSTSKRWRQTVEAVQEKDTLF